MDSEIEGDGVIENLYRLIWEKQEKDKGFRGFLLPDTVIYKYQQPRAWYFTNKEGCVKRKLKENLNAKAIEVAFLKNVPRSKVVASFFYSSEKGREVEYLEKDEFVEFLMHRHKIYNGVLQKFVDPNGKKNATVQMIWTPHLSLFEKRENINDLYNFHLSIYERVPTFEDECHQSAVTPFNGTEVRSFLHELGEALSDHISSVTLNRVSPTRMVLIFKQDHQSRLNFILATSIRCHSSRPVDISTQSHLPSIINPNRSTSKSKSPLCIQKSVICKNCENPCELDRIYEIYYKDVINKTKEFEGIPYLIHRLHPYMKIEDYAQVKGNLDFGAKVALICDDCYLLFIHKRKVIKKGSSAVRVKRIERIDNKTPAPGNLTERKISFLDASEKKNSLIEKPKFNSLLERKPTPSLRVLKTSRSNYPEIPDLAFNRSLHRIKSNIKT